MDIDTRQFGTHGEWCAWLSSRGSLAIQHASCARSITCKVRPSDRTTVEQCRARNAERIAAGGVLAPGDTWRKDGRAMR